MHLECRSRRLFLLRLAVDPLIAIEASFSASPHYELRNKVVRINHSNGKSETKRSLRLSR